MPETLGIVKEFAQDIKREPGVYMGFEITSEELGGLMNEAVGLAQKRVPGLQVNSQLRVNLLDDRCIMTGQVGVDYPGMGHSSVEVKRVQIGNSSQAGLLQVEVFEVDKNLSFQVRAAAKLAGIDIDNEMSKALQNPYKGIYEVMQAELLKQGVKLNQLGLQIREGKLAMGISGNPVS